MRFKLLIWLITLGIGQVFSQKSFALNAATNIVDIHNQAVSFERFVYLTNNYEHKLTPLFTEDGEMFKVELDLLDNNHLISTPLANTNDNIPVVETINFKELHEVYSHEASAFTNIKEMKGLPAPNFKVVNAANEEIELYDLEDEIVVINFWFSRCAPCIAEIPDLNALQVKYKHKPVTFLAMTVENYNYTEKYLSNNDFNFEVIPEAQKIAAAYKVIGYPSTIIIDRNKKVDNVFTGSMTNVFEELDQVVQKCLLQNKEDVSVELMDRGESLVFNQTKVYTEEGKQLKEDQFYDLLMNYQCNIYKHITSNESIYYTITKNKKK